MNNTNRIILLIDMDCFFCQVEENLDATLKGKPIAVVQYNQWRGGGIIAVNYPARDRGVTRHMRGDEAKKKCPEIALVRVPNVRGKADLSKYRDAGKRVADVLQTFTPGLERASVDEAYLDITSIVNQRIQDNKDQITPDDLKNTFVVGNATSDFIENVIQHRVYNENNFKLALGGIIAEEIRAEVFRVTGYTCSAGIAHNKILAKLVCGLNKPNKQTILPQEAISELYENMPIRKIKSLGGKFGNNVMEKLKIEFMGELSKFSQRDLAKKFDEKSASWLYNIAKGIDTDPVTTRLVAKSIGSCKKFPGRTALCTKQDIQHWLNELAGDIFERLEKDYEENCRRARQMVVSFVHETENDEINGTKSHPLTSYEQNKISENAFKIIEKNCMREDGSYRVIFLGISAGQFQDVKKVKEITSFFKNMRDNNIKKDFPKKNLEEEINDHQKFEKTNEDDTTTSNSIFSCSTQESDIDTDSLIFYEQIHPESVANQDFTVQVTEIDKDSDTSNDSISNEINFEDKQSRECDETEVTQTQSFFSKYFRSRDFNTSKSFNNNDLSDDKESATEDCEVINNDNDITTESTDIKSDDSCCPHCGKIIDRIDYQSHLDYHFALSIVKNEAHLYNKPQSTSSSTPTTNNGSKKKTIAAHKSIEKYFKSKTTEDLQSNEMNICKDCNKRIASSEWNIHVDYHAAKKLHLEINAQQNIPMKHTAVKSKLKGQKNIEGFLKSI